MSDDIDIKSNDNKDSEKEVLEPYDVFNIVNHIMYNMDEKQLAALLKYCLDSIVEGNNPIFLKLKEQGLIIPDGKKINILKISKFLEEESVEKDGYPTVYGFKEKEETVDSDFSEIDSKTTDITYH